MTETYGERLYRGGTVLEHQRHAAMSDAFDGASRSAMAALGPMTGWDCLDVGAGEGSVARWLADEAGATGRVLALDIDPALDVTPHPRVEVRHGDITDPELRLATYDLVHTRFLLINLRSREDVLRRLASVVRPGGYLVVSDMIDFGSWHSPSAVFRGLMAAYWQTVAEVIGTDTTFALRHHGLFVDAGLTEVRAEVFVPTMAPGSPVSRLLGLSAMATADRMIALGKLDRPGIERALAHLDEPGASDVSFAMVTTVGRKPA